MDGGANDQRAPKVGADPDLDEFVTKPSPNPNHVYIHGKPATYQRHGCRCVECKLAQRLAQRKFRESKTGKPFVGPPKEWPHGTPQRYRAVATKCRCDLCVEAYRKAKRDYAKLLRKGLVGKDAVLSLDEWIFD